jgi:urease
MTQSAQTRETVSTAIYIRPPADAAVANAFYGSFLPIPSEEAFPIPEPPKGYLAGAVICQKGKIQFNVGRKRWAVEVKNAGDRPIQVGHYSVSISHADCKVGSHYPFLETNPSLIFDRMLSYGTHLDIASGTAVRFEPGERKTVSLVQYGGKMLLSGGNGLGTGAFDESLRETTIKGMVEKHKFGHKKQDKVSEGAMAEMDREVVSYLPR